MAIKTHGLQHPQTSHRFSRRTGGRTLTSNHKDQIRVEIDRITYRNDENGWSVVKVRNVDDSSTHSATGHFTMVSVGESFELFGSWTKHAQYGRQFKIERAVPIRPNTEKAIKKYLSSGIIKGVGPKTADKITSHFGKDTLTILDDNPDALLEVSSIGPKKIKSIISGWSEQRAVADVMMFLNTHGISPVFAHKIYRLYGNDCISIVSSDPYRLAIDIKGVGFLSADKIAQSVGIAKDSRERIQAAIVFQLLQGEDSGHCYLTDAQLTQALMQTLGLEEDVLLTRSSECLDALNEMGAIKSESVLNNEDRLVRGHFKTDLYISETNVARAISLLLEDPKCEDKDRVETWLKRYSEVSNVTLSELQLEAVKKAVSYRVFALTGGPGVGKTTTANTIIRLLKAMGKSVALAAPTGRAAQRLSEVSAAPAKTIHRLLEWTPQFHGFSKNEDNPIEADAIIIDEASMLDIRLADALFRSIKPTSQLILIGDVDQLPSVGPGNVLRDLIESSKVPYERLDEIFRQAATSNIIQTAHAINKGSSPSLSDDENSDCRFLTRDSKEEIKSTISALVAKELPKQNFDPITDIQVLTPMNRSELGTLSLNDDLQEILNPKAKGVPEFKRGSLTFRQGDKVIQNVNNYELGVFNGDIGIIQHTNVEDSKLIVAFGERIVTYEPEHVLDLKLAYAITIHKSQGSEFPVVIIPASMQHYVMLQRNLFYTALTRAKKLAVFVGAPKALTLAIRNQSSRKRQTTLIERLRAAMEGRL